MKCCIQYSESKCKISNRRNIVKIQRNAGYGIWKDNSHRIKKSIFFFVAEDVTMEIVKHCYCLIFMQNNSNFVDIIDSIR